MQWRIVQRAWSIQGYIILMTTSGIEVMLLILQMLFICSELMSNLPTVCSTINSIASGNSTKTNKSLQITGIFHDLIVCGKQKYVKI
jgi:hypothetical protein